MKRTRESVEVAVYPLRDVKRSHVAFSPKTNFFIESEGVVVLDGQRWFSQEHVKALVAQAEARFKEILERSEKGHRRHMEEMLRVQRDQLDETSRRLPYGDSYFS